MLIDVSLKINVTKANFIFFN